MLNPQVPYDFPATLYVYHGGVPGTDAFDVQTTCQWRAYADVQAYEPNRTNLTNWDLVELLVPYGVDIRDSRMASAGVGDRISVTDDSTHDYQVLWVEVIYRGFPRQCYLVVARRLSVGPDGPLA